MGRRSYIAIAGFVLLLAAGLAIGQVTLVPQPRQFQSASAATSFTAPAFAFSSARGSIQASADGAFLLLNNAGTDFARLALGGTTSSFPAIKRNAAGLDFRVADDSAYADVTMRRVLVAGTGSIVLGSNAFAIATTPTIGTCGTTPSVTASNGSIAFRTNVGTGGIATSCAVTLPTAASGWNCFATDVTTQSASVFLQKMTASSTTSATVTNYNTAGAATAFVASDILAWSCFGY